MNVIVRLMTEDDIDQVTEISSLSFSHSWSRKSYEQELQNSLAKYFVAEIDNRVIGFVGTWLIVDESHITNVAVHPEFRKHGIASKLIDAILLLYVVTILSFSFKTLSNFTSSLLTVNNNFLPLIVCVSNS